MRIPNPFLPDTPQRIATDTSQKLAIRFGETIKAYEKNPSLDTADLKYIPLVFAGWLRYLRAWMTRAAPLHSALIRFWRASPLTCQAFPWGRHSRIYPRWTDCLPTKRYSAWT